MPMRPTRIRLTLGGLMILIFGLALALAWQARLARQQREAVTAVRRHGGWVHYAHEMVNGKPAAGRQPRGPAWLRRILGDEYFQTLVYADFEGDATDRTDPRNEDERPCDDALAALSSQHGLKFLILSKGQATDEGLGLIAGLTGLEQLSLMNSEGVTDAGMQHIGKLVGLKTLYVGSSQVTDRGFLSLSALSNLTFLSVRSNRISDAGLAAIAGAKGLSWLTLGADGRGRSPISDEGMATIANLDGLETLLLPNTKITGDGVRRLRNLAKLKALTLDRSPIGDNTLALFKQCGNLTYLSLRETDVTDAGLDHLRRLPKLRQLMLHGSRCTEEGKQAFKGSMPSILYID